jgi:hypothetical protein
MFGGDWAFDSGASGGISGWVPPASKLELVSTGLYQFHKHFLINTSLNWSRLVLALQRGLESVDMKRTTPLRGTKRRKRLQRRDWRELWCCFIFESV